MARDIYANVSAQALTSSRVWWDSDGTLLIKHQQDVDPILELNKRQANDYEPRRNALGLRHIARIPNVVVMQLQRDGIMDHKGQIADERRLWRFLSDPENRHLRVDNGRRL